MNKFAIGIILFISISCEQRPYSHAAVSLLYNSAIADTSFASKLSNAAISLTHQPVQYDPSYFVIAYPDGDVPANKGVCSDVVIRAYRKLGIDLQKNIHEDMLRNFEAYPKKWNLTKPDSNIDHRRVPNLMKFFTRQNAQLPVTDDSRDYQVGDIVCWNLPHNLTHIGIVIDSLNDENNRRLIVHNIGGGQVIEDCLFSYKIIGHYRYSGFQTITNP